MAPPQSPAKSTSDDPAKRPGFLRRFFSANIESDTSKMDNDVVGAAVVLTLAFAGIGAYAAYKCYSQCSKCVIIGTGGAVAVFSIALGVGLWAQNQNVRIFSLPLIAALYAAGMGACCCYCCNGQSYTSSYTYHQ